MKHENYTAYISRYLGIDTTYYISIDEERYDGKFYETFSLVNRKEFGKLNEAKRFAKEFINSNN